MNQDDYIKAKLIDRVWSEDHQDALHGIKLAAFIIRNRVNAGWGSWLQMIKNFDNFAGNLRGPDLDINFNDPLFRKVNAAVEDIYSGMEPDDMTSSSDPFSGKTTTALYFANLNKPLTEFFQTKILGDKENHRHCGQCGSLTLFA